MTGDGKPYFVEIPPVVMDASAVLAILLDPQEQGAAIREAVRDCELLAPTILPYEVVNVLRRRWSAGMMSEAQAQKAIDIFDGMEIELWSWLNLRDRIWGLKGSITTYDAAYVALAESLGGRLVTTDAKLAAMVPSDCEVCLF